MLTYEIRPGVACGPFRLGMSRMELMEVLEKSGLAWMDLDAGATDPPMTYGVHGTSVQIEMDAGTDQLAAVRLHGGSADMRDDGEEPPYAAELFGLDVFRSSARTVVEMLSHHDDVTLAPGGSSATCRTLGLHLWADLGASTDGLAGYDGFLETLTIFPPAGGMRW